MSDKYKLDKDGNIPFVQEAQAARTSALKKIGCLKCGKDKLPEYFIPRKDWRFPQGRIPICDTCLNFLIDKAAIAKNEWKEVDSICQWLDIPFIPAEWEKYYPTNKGKTFEIYIPLMGQKPYSDLDWKYYQDKYLEMRASNENYLIPGYEEHEIKELKRKWGSLYDKDDLFYLEDLFNGITSSYPITGTTQIDQIKKLCKVSLMIDESIDAGKSFKELIGSYEILVKAAGLQPKNVSDSNSFESVGELFAFLEARGWINRFYDNEQRDIVDKTMADITQYLQKLYVNESSIGEEIDKRIENLKFSQKLDHNYDLAEEGEDWMDEYLEESEIEVFDPEGSIFEAD